MKTNTPKYDVGSRVVHMYSSWSKTEGSWEIEATVVQAEIDKESWEFRYLLRVNPADIDSTDRTGLTGTNRDEYWFVWENTVLRKLP